MKDYVPYKEALTLKDLGFDEISRFGNETSLYDKEGNFTFYANYGFMYSGLSGGYIKAPLYQQVFRWFRDEHNIFATPLYGEADETYWYLINYLSSNEKPPQSGSFDSYEQAELACLRKLIKIVKNNLNK